jgi:hypothetical protein
LHQQAEWDAVNTVLADAALVPDQPHYKRKLNELQEFFYGISYKQELCYALDVTTASKIALIHIEMKSRWAQEHFDALEKEIENWIKLPPYTIRHEDDLKKVLQVWRVEIGLTPESIPKALGDWVCCLRAALDQMAWQMAHILAPSRAFTEGEERNISFLIFKENNSRYQERRKLFPTEVADAFDMVQPYLLGNAYKNDLLWQLNEIWNLDKHRTIPISNNSLMVRFPMWGWESYKIDFDYGFEIHFPLGRAWKNPVGLEPEITFEVLFGQGAFEVSLIRLREINDFVRNTVIPKFSLFFP